MGSSGLVLLPHSEASVVMRCLKNRISPVYAWTAYLVFAWLTAVLSEQLDCCGLDELVSVSFFGEMT